ncbi:MULTISPECIES: phage minor head protein [unclassified Yoonia]|uniref:phage head morphogenesis protein n=1 Tax=unclassified Yoonia TaxID=2629118 RepID=UPI002AFE9321|nr:MULTISPECIES: phage minor head protein [unclassified Yoonia]
MADTIRGTFRRPFKEQLIAFRLRMGNMIPTAAWDDLMREEHDKAFVVAGAMKADLLSDIAEAIEKSIVQGTTYDTFKKDFRAIVEKRGWHGWTGEESERRKEWRMRTIYKTNMRTSYMAGRHAQLVNGKFAYWVYRHGGSRDPRPQHLAWDRLILPSDHPFWATHFPPNDWGCSCGVAGARSIRGAIRLGGNPEVQLDPDWDVPRPNTGTPPGIGKGWDYAPGGTVTSLIIGIIPKFKTWPESVTRDFLKSLDPEIREQFLTALELAGDV